MIYVLVTVKDRGIEAYQPLMAVRAEGQAIRGFMDAIANPNNADIHKHPDDFDLYSLGTFNDETGEIIPHSPKKIADGKQLSQQGE